MFLQRKTSHCRDGPALGPKGPKHYIFGNQFNSKNAQIPYIFFISMLENIWYHNYHNYQSGLNSQEIVIFVPILGIWGLKLNRNKIHNFLWIQFTSGKTITKTMFSFKNIEEHMENELSGNSRVKQVAKNGALVPDNSFHVYVG